jgi:hypothetical protein
LAKIHLPPQYFLYILIKRPNFRNEKITTSSKAMKIKSFALSPYYSILLSLVLFTACTSKKKDEAPKTNPLIADGFGIQDHQNKWNKG